MRLTYWHLRRLGSFHFYATLSGFTPSTQPALVADMPQRTGAIPNMNRSQVRKWTGRTPAALPPAALGLARPARAASACQILTLLALQMQRRHPGRSSQAVPWHER